MNPFSSIRPLLALASLLLLPGSSWADVSQWVNPRIGSEGLGRVIVGPSCPFGMVKPSPDCTSAPNSGWLPMPEQVDGFSQTHVSGTGGGPKYGNVLIQPFCSGFETTSHPAWRADEEIRLGYYGTHYTNGIGVEVTTAERASMYRIRYPQDSAQMMVVDAGWFLGDQVGIDTRESQQFVASEIEVRSDHEVSGLTRIRGGWNNGKAYTVYFHIEFDKPFTQTRVWDNHGKQGVNLQFDNTSRELNLKVGISFVGERKAKANIAQYIGTRDFDEVESGCVAQWEELLQRIEIDESASPAQKRMFYTGLYHTMLEPVDRTGENPLWTDYVRPGEPESGLVPYYDDFYAIWDTYRTSSPLITLIDPRRQSDIVRSLINIGRRDGYMPDARSGNSNGRTQGGSNAEIVLADAFLKGLGQDSLSPIDWREGLRQMLNDATLPPGGNQEAEGRGGLTEYLRYGYVPYGIDRSGNRTMEYAFCDYAIAEVAAGLGRLDIAGQYYGQSKNWKNLWRADYEHAGTRGFIMPRDTAGQWLDTLVVGHSSTQRPTFVYTPVTNESPWNQAWWSTVFYEATSWEYSLSVPHDVDELIRMCGGAEAFERRLDTFFDRGFYNVNNEPSFLTPCLYHWIARPDRSSDRVQEIIARHFNDSPEGLPGNDDSGAMSSWLAFHMMGLYPNAGTSYYLLHTPLLKRTTLHLQEGKDFTIVAKGLSEKKRYIVGAKLNGRDYPWAAITHQQLLEGGVLELKMGAKPTTWGAYPYSLWPVHQRPHLSLTQIASFAWNDSIETGREYHIDFDLRTQHRHFYFTFDRTGDKGMLLKWRLSRHGRWQTGQYQVSSASLWGATTLSYEAPVDGHHYQVPDDQVFLMIPGRAFREYRENGGGFRFNNDEFEEVGIEDRLIHFRSSREGYEIWVNSDPELPIIVKMKNNPVGIDWEIKR